MSDDFDWHDEQTVVVKSQAALAVYINDAGSISIRQERTWDEDEDTWIVVQPEHAQAIADALLSCADHLDGHRQQAPAPSTAAERQRRYRQRHAGTGAGVTRDGNRDGQGVTPHRNDLLLEAS